MEMSDLSGDLSGPNSVLIFENVYKSDGVYEKKYKGHVTSDDHSIWDSMPLLGRHRGGHRRFSRGKVVEK